MKELTFMDPNSGSDVVILVGSKNDRIEHNVAEWLLEELQKDSVLSVQIKHFDNDESEVVKVRPPSLGRPTNAIKKFRSYGGETYGQVVVNNQVQWIKMKDD